MSTNIASKFRFRLPWLLLLLSLFWRCEYDRPENIYPLAGAPEPVIIKVEPDSAIGGVMDIKIIGQNFSEHAEQNIVFLGSSEAVVKQATTTELIVLRPLRLSGPNLIKLAVRTAMVIATHGPYYLEPGLVALPALGQVNAITMDKDENLYAEGNKKIFKISPRGEVTEFGAVDFISSAMRIGTGGYLYIQRKDNRDLYRIGPGGGAAERYARIRKRAHFFDFDVQGYIYSGSLKYGLCVTSPDGAVSTEIPGYADAFQINAIRVFNSYLYLSADTISSDPARHFSGIYRLAIKGNGELGPRELVFDWARSGEFAAAIVNDLTFAEDGEMYVATDYLNPVLVIHPDGSAGPLFAGELEPPATQICWGNGKYLYLNKLGREDKNSAIYRLITGKPGAPYFGRN